MPDILDQFEHDPDLFRKMSPEEVLKRVAQVTIEKLLKDRLKEQSIEELLAVLPHATLAVLALWLKEQGAFSSPKSGESKP